MLKLDRRIYVRVSEPDIERARQLAAATGLSVSELVRVLLQMLTEIYQVRAVVLAAGAEFEPTTSGL